MPSRPPHIKASTSGNQHRAPNTGGQRAGKTTRRRSTARQAKSRRPQDRGDLAPLVVPKLTRELAYDLAKVLTAGLPPDRAVQYLVPGLDAETARDTASTWLGSKLALDAMNQFNGGEWPDLDPDRRLSIAFDKHKAECAHYLYTHSLEAADKGEMGKMQYSREVLEAALKGGDPDDPLARAMKDILGSMEAVSRKTVPVQVIPTVTAHTES